MKRDTIDSLDLALKVRALEPDDAPALIALRREALSSAPLAFGSSLEDDRGLSLESMRSSLANVASFAVLGAFEGEALVGMAGIIRLEKMKSRSPSHDMGNVRDADARSWPGIVQVQLSVFETAEEAGRLYRRAGFREWEEEPRAMQWEGGFVAEHHLVLDLA